MLQDVQAGFQVFFVAFPNGYLIAKDIDRVPSYIVYLINIDDIGAVNFEKSLPDI